MDGTEDNKVKVWVHLYGGEQDGFRCKIELKTKAPKKFFIWHVNDGAKIDEVRGQQRMVLKNKLATMAYELFDEIPDGGDGLKEYRYKRLESADKVTADPVT